MSDYDTLKAQVADYANRSDWSDALVAGFISQAEQRLNADLRIDRMIATAQNTVTCGCSDLPDDWLQMDFLLIANPATPTGWTPLHYRARDEFYRLPAQPNWANYNCWSNYYTIEGRTVYFGGSPNTTDGTVYQMSYYQEVPVMATVGSSWVFTKFPKLYLFASLSNADFHAIGEENTAMLLDQQVAAMISQLNENHRRAKASGSRLNRARVRSFG